MAHALNESLWRQLNDAITIGMRAWRLQHPTATLRAIETDLDARLSRARARMREDLAMESTAATWQAAARVRQPACRQCATPRDERGAHPRTLLTHAGQTVTVERSYGVCPAGASGLFPPR